MAKAGKREERESSLASGWTVHADPMIEGDGATAGGSVETLEREAIQAHDGARNGDVRDADGAGDADASTDGSADDSAVGRDQMSNAMLVVLGVVGGLYLLYAWIWLSWTQALAANAELTAQSSGAIGGTLQLVVFWTAPLAPLLWFVSVLVLNRGGKTRSLVLWLVIGAVLLAPLPVLSGLGGAA